MSDASRDWSVDIHDQGRCGAIVYREPAGSISGYWEFSGGDTLASIHLGDPAVWGERHHWALARRQEILQRVAADVIRRKAPGCHACIDETTGWIQLRQGDATAGHADPSVAPPDGRRAAPRGGAPGGYLRVSEIKGRIMFYAGLVLILGAVALWAFLQSASIRVPHGSPSGDSVRAGGEIATLIQTLEAYVPSLHRDPGKDRYRLALFLYPADGSSGGRMIPLIGDLQAQDASRARLLGSDGRTLWFDVLSIGGVVLASGERIGPEQLRAANPALANAWDDPRRFSFANRLRLSLTDGREMEIDPGSLQAVPAQTPRSAPVRPSGPKVEDYLCAGVRPSPNAWLGLHSGQEAASDYHVRARLGPVNDATRTRDMRRIHRGELGPEQARGYREILSIAPVSDTGYPDAAFLRAAPDGEPLQLADPPGFLMVFTSAAGPAGTLSVARVDTKGQLQWSVDTGIDRFAWTQVLPDERFTAFVGSRPRVPGKVPEPILVSIDTRTGAIAASTLWMSEVRSH